MSSSTAPYRCPIFIFAPLLQSGKVFGMDLVEGCSCRPAAGRKKMGGVGRTAFGIYAKGVELFLWSVAVVTAVRIFQPDLYCLRIVRAFKEYALHASVATFFSVIYAAWQFSVLKRKKLTLHYPRSGYRHEWRRVQLAPRYLFVSAWLVVSVFTVIALTCVIFVYWEIKRQKGTDTEALVCSLFHTLLFSCIAGQLLFLSIFAWLFFLLLAKRYLRLSYRMEKIGIRNYRLRDKLENIIVQQMELWECLESLNHNLKTLFPLIYTHFMYQTCFCLYAVLFIKVEFIFRIVLSLLFWIIFNGLILACWKLSSFSSLIYDHFVSIGRFSSANLSLLFKYKVACFMKRYGRNPLGISMAGFFYIKRNFVIRVISGLYSTFSTLLQLSGAFSHRRRCVVTYPRSIFNLSETWMDGIRIKESKFYFIDSSKN